MSYLRLYYEALSDDSDLTGCPANCVSRDDVVSYLTYTDGQRDSVFPWETADTVYVKLTSPVVKMSKVRKLSLWSFLI